MQGFSVLKGVFDFLIDTNLIKEVFHSVEIVETDNKRFPAYPIESGDLVYVGVDDTKIMNCYIRQVNDLRIDRVEKISSSVSEYETVIPHRIVFFNDHEKRNQDDLIKIFIGVAFLPGVRLKSVIVDKEKLLQLETKPHGFKFDSKTFYSAIDIDIVFRLRRNNCEEEIGCENIKNPYCK